jgi:hypothetical protein
VFVWSDSSSDDVNGLRRRLVAGFDVIVGVGAGARVDGDDGWWGGAENVGWAVVWDVEAADGSEADGVVVVVTCWLSSASSVV